MTDHCFTARTVKCSISSVFLSKIQQKRKFAKVWWSTGVLFVQDSWEPWVFLKTHLRFCEFFCFEKSIFEEIFLVLRYMKFTRNENSLVCFLLKLIIIWKNFAVWDFKNLKLVFEHTRGQMFSYQIWVWREFWYEFGGRLSWGWGHA